MPNLGERWKEGERKIRGGSSAEKTRNRQMEKDRERLGMPVFAVLLGGFPTWVWARTMIRSFIQSNRIRNSY